MNITDLKVSKTIQVNQYEPATIEAHATIDENESFEGCASELMARITSVLTGKEGPMGEAPKQTPPKKKEEKKEVEKKAPAKKKAAPKKVKAVEYNREVKAHQQTLGKLLHEHFDGWKDDADMKANAKQASADLTGEDFMDSKGAVLETFVEKLKEAMGDESL